MFKLFLILFYFFSFNAYSGFYYELYPEVVTNCDSASSNSLGYVRAHVSFRASNKQNLDAIIHHEPLLRSSIVSCINLINCSELKNSSNKYNFLENACLKQQSKYSSMVDVDKIIFISILVM